LGIDKPQAGMVLLFEIHGTAP